MSGRVTITKRHTGRFYVGLDGLSFGLLCKMVEHARHSVIPSECPRSASRIFKAFESFVASNSHTTDKPK